MWRDWIIALLVLAQSGVAGSVAAQSDVVGRVVSYRGGQPVAGATIRIAGDARSWRSDSAGGFRLDGLPAARVPLTIRANGYNAYHDTLDIGVNEVLVRDFRLLSAAQALPAAEIVAPAPVALADVEDRRRRGSGGHFILRKELARAEGGVRSTGDLLALVPGVAVKRGSNRAWAASGGRAVNPAGGCAFCRGGKLGPAPKRPNPADVSAGAREACYMDVYLDGVMVFNSTEPELGLFDVNAVQPADLEAIEVYASAGQIPAQYNRTANGCGVLLLWTRR